jgi:hypothetical protein
MSMKNSSDTIGNRTRDRPVCSAVPQPLCHRVPQEIVYTMLNYVSACYIQVQNFLILLSPIYDEKTKVTL